MTATTEDLNAPAASAQSLITYDNLDEVFAYHAWSPEQVERGNAIRAAAKAVVKTTFDHAAATKAMRDAIKNSAIPAPENPSDLYRYAQNRRAKALASLNAPVDMLVQESIASLNEIVMLANSAITLEAAQLIRDTPPKEAAS